MTAQYWYYGKMMAIQDLFAILEQFAILTQFYCNSVWSQFDLNVISLQFQNIPVWFKWYTNDNSKVRIKYDGNLDEIFLVPVQRCFKMPNMEEWINCWVKYRIDNDLSCCSHSINIIFPLWLSNSSSWQSFLLLVLPLFLLDLCQYDYLSVKPNSITGV